VSFALQNGLTSTAPSRGQFLTRSRSTPATAKCFRRDGKTIRKNSTLRTLERFIEEMRRLDARRAPSPAAKFIRFAQLENYGWSTGAQIGLRRTFLDGHFNGVANLVIFCLISSID
jgi:hypothetical protein